MTISPPDALVGVQTPRLSNFPEGSGSDGDLVVELMARAGVELDSWQRWTLDRMLRYRGDGKWACPTCLLIVPRQNGKGEVLIARMLAGLFVFEEELVTYTAHEFKTATEHFRRIAYLVESTPELNAKVKSIHTANGKESIELKSRQRLRFLARSKKSGRGFTGDCVILDEAYELPDETLDALLPTMSARTHKTRGGPQLWYSSSAGMETSYQLTRVRNKALEGSGSIGFAEWSAESADDPDGLRRANPGLGVRIAPSFVEDVERESLSPEGFQRERLGIWAAESPDRVIPRDAWDAVLRDAELSGRMVVAVDATPDLATSSIAVASADGVVEVHRHGDGTGWLLDELSEAWSSLRTPVVLDSAGPVAYLASQLRGRGVEVVEVGSREVAQSCAAFFEKVADRRLSVRPVHCDHCGRVTISDAVDAAVRQPVGDGWRWSRKTPDADVSPLMAASLAVSSAASDERVKVSVMWV